MNINIIGISGGLGNQMFQYAYYLSVKYRTSPKDIAAIYISPYKKHNGYELDKVFGIKKKIMINLAIGFIKKYFRSHVLYKTESNETKIEEYIKKKQNRIIYHTGYWQSEKYFLGIENLIRLTFEFSITKISNKNNNLLEKIRCSNSVSIHVRRGDYENEPDIRAVHGGICDLNYYKNAINIIGREIIDPQFYIFSNDYNWVNENLSFIPNSCIVDWNNKENCWQDMMMMSNCKHNIIANSSFSWWGAWLNKNSSKIVIAPAKWFNNINAIDLVPDTWVRI